MNKAKLIVNGTPEPQVVGRTAKANAGYALFRKMRAKQPTKSKVVG